MKEIWTKERAEYHGEFVDFDPIFSWPKPLQAPHPPIVLGASPDADVLRGYRDGGVARAVFGLPQAGAGRILPILDRLASLTVEVG